MAIYGQSRSSLIAAMVSAAKSASKIVLDFSRGSVPLALFQAVAGVALWLQRLIMQVLLQSRASTSKGSDLDSWMGDFGFARLGAQSSVGSLLWSRNTPTNPAVVPVGALAGASVGGAQFIVTADPTNSAYSPNAGGTGIAGYTVAASVASILVAAAAVSPGAEGNVIANTVNNSLQAVNGIDYVTNPSAFNGGVDAESDIAFRLRFQAFISALFKGTRAAYAYALNSIQVGLSFQILENTTPSLVYRLGYITICLDDGSGDPPMSLMQAALAAVEAARTAGVTVQLIPPTIAPATVALTVVSVITANHAADITAATNALTAYLNSVPVGATLAYSRLAQIAYDSSANISNVTGVTLNSGTADLAVTSIQVVKAGSVTVL